MARKRVEVAKDIGYQAERMAVVKKKRRKNSFKAAGPQKFNAGSTGIKTFGVTNPVSLLDMAERMVELGSLYARAPHKRGNFGGGLKRLSGGSADPVYPFRRSVVGRFATGNRRPYMNRFVAEAKFTGSTAWVEFRNESVAATFVEYGTASGDAEEAYVGAGFGKAKPRKPRQFPNDPLLGNIDFSKNSTIGLPRGRGAKSRDLYFKIPLKKSYGKAALRRQQARRQAARRAGEYPSDSPEMRRYYYEKKRYDEGIALREYAKRAGLSDAQLRAERRRRGLLVQGTLRERLRKKPKRPDIGDKFLNRAKNSHSFIKEQTDGEIYLFTRKYRPYPGYGILRRAATDALLETLR